jgi:hypothetical protein
MVLNSNARPILQALVETKERVNDSENVGKAQPPAFKKQQDDDSLTRMLQVLSVISSILGNLDIGMISRVVRSRCSVIRMCRAPADTASCSSIGVVTFVTPSYFVAPAGPDTCCRERRIAGCRVL